VVFAIEAGGEFRACSLVELLFGLFDSLLGRFALVSGEGQTRFRLQSSSIHLVHRRVRDLEWLNMG